MGIREKTAMQAPYIVNMAPHCAQNFAPSRSSAWHWPQARRDAATGAGAMLDATMGAEADAGAIGIGRQRPSDAAGVGSGKDTALSAGTAIPSRLATCSASARVS